MAAGDRGLAADPDRVEEFRDNVPVALELAARIGCSRLNALVGLHRSGFEREAQLELARENVAWAAGQARAQDATILIEPINRHDNGDVLLETSSEAIAFIDSVGADNVQLQFDIYHMQRVEGNLAETISSLLPRIGHVQIPTLRREPSRGPAKSISASCWGCWTGAGTVAGWVSNTTRRPRRPRRASPG